MNDQLDDGFVDDNTDTNIIVGEVKRPEPHLPMDSQNHRSDKRIIADLMGRMHTYMEPMNENQKTDKGVDEKRSFDPISYNGKFSSFRSGKSLSQMLRPRPKTIRKPSQVIPFTMESLFPVLVRKLRGQPGY